MPSKKLKKPKKVMPSGQDDRKLVAFLYLLLRDHLPSGKVEGIMEGWLDDRMGEFKFTNGFLAGHAQNIADRLLK